MKSFLEPLTPTEENHWIERFQNGDKEAKDILIERNLRLVAHIAKKYYSENRENEELISIGIIGLIKAVNTYNPQKGKRLVRVRQYVEKVLSKREREIIVMRYGLGGEEAMTQKAVGKAMNISRSYVSRIEKKALEKLKKAFDNSYSM